MNRKQRRANAGTPSRAMTAFVETFNVGLATQRAGDMDKAAAAYRKAMALNPNVPLLYNNLGVVVYNQGKMDEAIALQKKAIALDPNMSIAHNNLGVVYNATSRQEDAVASFARAIALAPNDPEPMNNYGDSLVKLSRFAEGAEALYKALAMNPNYVEAYTNLGTALWGLGKLDEAVASFRRVIELQPDVAMAHKNLGIMLLLMGQYIEGWREYDWRWAADKIPMRVYPFPVWRGEPLGAGKLLVWAEQGVGDHILQASMMSDLVARGPQIVWEVEERLVPLFQRSYPNVKVVGWQTPASSETYTPDIKAHISAGSMGQFLRTDIADFPRTRRRYLEPDRVRSDEFKSRLGLMPGEKLVGMSWLSTNLNFGQSKSTVLADWVDILKPPGFKFVDLQYGDTAAERQALQDKFGVTLHHLDDLNLREDLDGFAALTAACDLVVTVSNSTAHFAGALDIPVWILISAGVGKFWYWGHDSESVPWYPSARLIRQNAKQDWGPSLQVVAERLAAFSP
ncbi:MAG: tetratricopeptide repeat protein [Alphaproteobacteria bacterium]|nr:tetratricopeptide repeat protein [Alphaproteobacteria bacterium]